MGPMALVKWSSWSTEWSELGNVQIGERWQKLGAIEVITCSQPPSPLCAPALRLASGSLHQVIQALQSILFKNFSPPLKASSPIAQDCLLPVPLIKTLLALSSAPVPHALCCIPVICGTFSGFPYFALPRDLATSSQDLLSSIRLTVRSNTCLGNAYAARSYD
ncbi:hypothetical protein DFH09DRAFT_1283130 [Mycena vulgaris]|nr:hypothetical protein DFH09DRAFT_1283130 [Mycena vulgaris]